MNKGYELNFAVSIRRTALEPPVRPLLMNGEDHHSTYTLLIVNELMHVFNTIVLVTSCLVMRSPGENCNSTIFLH